MFKSIFTGLIASSVFAVGSVAPDFSARDIDGNAVKLSEALKRGNVVVAFFPKAFTPGWTREVKAYQSGHAQLKKNNTTVLAISSDSQKTLREFRDKHAPDLTFISDPDGTLIELFGVKTPVLTFAMRTTFIVGPGRVIEAIHTGDDAIDASKAVAACEPR